MSSSQSGVGVVMSSLPQFILSPAEYQRCQVDEEEHSFVPYMFTAHLETSLLVETKFSLAWLTFLFLISLRFDL